MAQLDGAVLTFTGTIMVCSFRQPPLAFSGAPADLRHLDMMGGMGRTVLVSLYLNHIFGPKGVTPDCILVFSNKWYNND